MDLNKILKAFITYVDENILKLEFYIKQENFNEIQTITHRLKGNPIALMFPNASFVNFLGKEMTLSAKEENIEDIKSLFELFKLNYKEFKESRVPS
jgi:ABC-type uncharacterized transport system substrate-binding protein